MKLIITNTHRVLLCINEKINYTSKVAKVIDATVSHVNGLISGLIKEEFIEGEYIGRKKILKLTDKGKHTQELLRELKKLEW